MNNTIIRKVALTGTFTPAADKRTIASVVITSVLGNTSTAYLQGDTGDEVPLTPGEWHSFKRIDLSALKIKGTPGDILTVIGGSW